jgi:uncharacterized membrane protein HdeD (DUF308 family)
VVYAYIWESSSSSWFSSYSYTYFELDEIFVAISAVIALFVFAFAILRLVSGLSQKGNLKVMLSGVFRLITAIIIAVVSVLAVIEYPL